MHLVAAAELPSDGVEAQAYRLAEEVAELVQLWWRRQSLFCRIRLDLDLSGSERRDFGRSLDDIDKVDGLSRIAVPVRVGVIGCRNLGGRERGGFGLATGPPAAAFGAARLDGMGYSGGHPASFSSSLSADA